MLQNGVGWTTSSSIRGTRRLAVRPRSAELPIAPPVVPVVPIAPIVPVWPTETTPRIIAPVMPPVAPGKAEIAVIGLRRPTLRLGHIGDCFADGGEPFCDIGLICC